LLKIICCLLVTFFVTNYGCISNDTEEYIADLKSENVMVRNDAIYYLGENKNKLAVPMLIEFLNNDQPKETRLKAVEALGKIGEDSSVDVLLSALKEDNYNIKTAAIEAIGKIKDPRAVKLIIDMLDFRETRYTALWAIGNIGDESAVPALTKLLNHSDQYVRYNASQSLKKIGSNK